MDNRLMGTPNTKHQVIMIWQSIAGAKLRSDGVATLMARPEIEALQKIPPKTLRDAGRAVQALRPRSHLPFSEWLEAATRLQLDAKSPTTRSRSPRQLKKPKPMQLRKPKPKQLKNPNTPPKPQQGSTRRRSPNNRFHPMDAETTERIVRENKIAAQAKGCLHCGMVSHTSRNCPTH